MAKICLSTTRQTYIFMWHQNGVKDPNGVKYIFNRSVSWGKINFKKLQPIIDLMGEEAIKQMLCVADNLNYDINELTTTWTYNSDIFTLLEVHSEWGNINLENQREINNRKEKLAEEYNAIIRKDDILDPEVIKEIETAILNNTKKKLHHYLIQLHNKINDYFKLLYDPYIVEFKQIKEDIKKAKDELCRLNEESLKAKAKLKRQNYIINKYNNKYKNIFNYEL